MQKYNSLLSFLMKISGRPLSISHTQEPQELYITCNVHKISLVQIFYFIKNSIYMTPFSRSFSCQFHAERSVSSIEVSAFHPNSEFA